jgi:hypothetical protein
MTCEAKNGLHQILLNHICFMVTIFVIFQMHVTHSDLKFDMLHLCEFLSRESISIFVSFYVASTMLFMH